MNTFMIIIGALALVVAVIFWLRWRTAHSVNIDTFVAAVVDAADAGERAYRAQIATISRFRGREVSVAQRGLALARLLCALFPTAAFVVVESGDALLPVVKRHAPFSGKETWKVASGAALSPLNLADQPYFPQIRADTNRATQAYVEYFGSHFKGNPIADLAAAEALLSPLWNEALEISLGEIDETGYAVQFCTSGLHLFVEWFQALSKE